MIQQTLTTDDATGLKNYFKQQLGVEPKNDSFSFQLLVEQENVEDIKRLIDIAKACKGREYAPQVYDFKDLRDKWNKLVDWSKKNAKQTQPTQRRTFMPGSTDTVCTLIDNLLTNATTPSKWEQDLARYEVKTCVKATHEILHHYRVEYQDGYPVMVDLMSAA